MNPARWGFVVCAITLLGVAPAVAQTDLEEIPGADPASVAEPAATEAPPDIEANRPFRRLFPNLFSDVRRLPSADAAVILSIGSALSLAVRPVDVSATEHASAGGTNSVFAVGGLFGSGYTQAGAAIAAYAVGRLAKHEPTVHLGADLIRVQVLTGVLTHGVKMAIRRGRPGGAPGHMPATYSFPSAHASATWASATVLWRHLGWKAGVPATLLAVYVSGSRVQQNQHFPSDVLFGAALGVAAGRRVTVGHGRNAFVVAPAPTRGGVAVVAILERR